jgi:hypothetical protein
MLKVPRLIKTFDEAYTGFFRRNLNHLYLINLSLLEVSEIAKNRAGII